MLASITRAFFFAVALGVITTRSAQAAPPNTMHCPEVYYECTNSDGQLVSSQIYPCDKVLKQKKLRQKWTDPRDVEYGAVAPVCSGPCSPCSAVSWVNQNETQGAPSIQTQAPVAAMSGDVKIGMTMQQARAAWGEPKDIAKSATETSEGRRTLEIWNYQKDAYTMPSSLTFRNGTLSEIIRGSHPKLSKDSIHGIPLSSFSSETKFVPGTSR